MAETAFATGDALTKKIWGAKVIVEAKKDIFFDKFTGNTDQNIIQNKMELIKEKGDRITIPLRVRLTGEGTDTEDADLEGQEEQVTFYDFSVSLQERGHAVKAKNKLSLQRPAFDLRGQFKDALKDWLSEYIDRITVEVLSASPTTNRNIFGGAADTSTSDIDAADTMSVSLIQRAKRTARLASPKIVGINIKGKQRYVMIMHDYQTKALKADDDWKNGQYYAAIRGETNPIFSGALGMIDGVVLHEYERVETYNTWGTGAITGGRALLLGRQAGVHAFGQLPKWYEKLFQYNRIPGVAVDIVWRAAKTVFNSEDFACVAVDTYIAVD